MKITIKNVILALLLAAPATAQTITINWTSPQQTIDGFGGAAFTWNSGLTSSLADFFFTQNGIGLSIVRSGVIPDYSDCAAYGAAESPTFTCPSSSGATMAAGDLAVVQQAQARGVNIFLASSWSPEGAVKSNGSYLTGGSLTGNATNYTAYANALATFPAFLSAQGVSILYAISPQNEPDISQSYPSCTWTAAQFDAFVPYLSSALSTAGYSGVKIVLPENSSWSSSYDGFAATCMNDSACGPDVGILAQHGYGSPSIVAPSTYTYQPSHVWETEVGSQSGTYTGTMSDALTWATAIHDYLAVANVNAFIWWYLSDMPNNGNGTNATDNSALTDYSGNIPLRAYATGNWSKFVRPGWHRVGVTNSGSLLVTAFTDPTGLLTAIVVVNTSSSAVSSQAFSVGTTMGATATPWITSSTYSLAAQSPVAVSSGTLTYTIPADSVVTFAGSAITGGSAFKGAMVGARN